MKNRRFGVEIEFCSNGLGRNGVLECLRESFDNHNLRRWYFSERLGYDGSEFELRTPILRGKRGFDQLKLVMNTLTNVGCYTDYDDGLHIHHDAPEFIHSIDNCIRLVKSWHANRHVIYQFVDSYRVEGDGDYWACPRWRESEIEEMERTKEIPYWDRHDLNLASLSRHGSIEIRLHEGTLNYDEAEAWILFGQKFINRVLKHSMRNSHNAEKLLRKVKVNPKAEKVLIDKTKYRE